MQRSMNIAASRVTRTGLAILGVSTLIFGAVLFAAPQANAATYEVSEDDVYPYRDSHPLAETFHHWHVSTIVLSDDNLAEDQNLDDHFLFGECSVKAVSHDDQTVK